MVLKSKANARYFILINLLQSFSKGEMKRFNYFVSSTYFNTDQGVVKLLQVLNQEILGKKEFDIAAQAKVYQKVFANKKTSNEVLEEQQKKLLRAKMSLLTKLARRFLTIEALEENEACKIELLHKKLIDKKQFLLIHRLDKKKRNELDTEYVHGIDQCVVNFQMEVSKMNYLAQKGLLLKEDNFQELIYSLDVSYLLHKLTFHSTMHSILNVTTEKIYDFAPMEAIDSLLNLPQYAENPLIILYRTIIELMKTHEEEIFFNLLELLEQYALIIPKNYLVDFYNVACNFCARQIRAGQVDYHRKVFDLYRIMDDKDILIEKEYFQTIKFKNIVSLSCHVGEFDWATGIINKYYPFIKKEEQKNVYHFNLGAIEFYKKNYKTALSHLIRVDKINLAYDLDCRILLLKSYYQLDTAYDERTVQIFRSAKRFVDTNKSMPFSHKRSYKNFIQVLINIYRIRHSVGKMTLDSVRKKLAKMNFIADKKWILEKMKEINS